MLYLILQMLDTIKDLFELVKEKFPELNVNLNSLTNLNFEF